ncbi:hypothetical protein [Halostella litorea]|uniref:hypothetical protein n=1 Tax=Halostella litorea TaxID=2528831 RepID=UPI0013876126|nr:hypothetical protein [Halostella litorea]
MNAESWWEVEARDAVEAFQQHGAVPAEVTDRVERHLANDNPGTALQIILKHRK